MTATTDRLDADGSPPPASAHPLDRLSPEELAAAVDIVKASELFDDRVWFASVGLRAPDKPLVLSFSPGTRSTVRPRSS